MKFGGEFSEIYLNTAGFPEATADVLNIAK